MAGNKGKYGFDEKEENAYSNKMEDTPAFIPVESDSDPEVQIISEQMTEANNETGKKRLCRLKILRK